MSGSRRPRRATALLLAAVCAAPVGAQDQNSAFVNQFGTGGFSAGDSTTTALKVPLGFDLKPMTEDAWGLRLRVPVTFGISNLDFDAELEDLDFTTLLILPTMELRLPLREDVVFMPFVGLGGGWILDQSEVVWLGTVGARVEVVRPWGPFELGMSSTLRFDWEVQGGAGNDDSIGSLDVKVDFRRGLGLCIDDHEIQPGFYIRPYHFFQDLNLQLEEGVELQIENQLELGLSLGTRPPPMLLGITLPRLFVGYRFGDGLEGWRISLDNI